MPLLPSISPNMLPIGNILVFGRFCCWAKLQELWLHTAITIFLLTILLTTFQRLVGRKRITTAVFIRCTGMTVVQASFWWESLLMDLLLVLPHLPGGLIVVVVTWLLLRFLQRYLCLMLLLLLISPTEYEVEKVRYPLELSPQI